jgi:hypothetical protein
MGMWYVNGLTNSVLVSWHAWASVDIAGETPRGSTTRKNHVFTPLSLLLPTTVLCVCCCRY